jgi:hypothetical protein
VLREPAKLDFKEALKDCLSTSKGRRSAGKNPNSAASGRFSRPFFTGLRAAQWAFAMTSRLTGTALNRSGSHRGPVTILFSDLGSYVKYQLNALKTREIVGLSVSDFSPIRASLRSRVRVSYATVQLSE